MNSNNFWKSFNLADNPAEKPEPWDAKTISNKFHTMVEREAKYWDKVRKGQRIHGMCLPRCLIEEYKLILRSSKDNMKKYRIKIPIYHYQIWLVCNESYEIFTKYIKTKYKHNMSTNVFQGMTFFCDDRATVYLWLNNFTFLAFNYATLVHEICHIATYIMETRCVSITEQNDEPICYLMSHLYILLTTKIHKVLSRDEKEPQFADMLIGDDYSQ